MVQSVHCDVPPGSLLDGNCTPTSDRTCAPCNSLPPNAEYVEENSCEFECDEEFFLDGAICVPCSTECTLGYEPGGGCTRVSDLACNPCPAPPAFASYFLEGSCSTRCNDGYYFDVAFFLDPFLRGACRARLGVV